MNLKVNYAGLELKNPILAGSSGHTDNIDDLIKFEKSGASAIVLKSIFEEEIFLEFQKEMKEIDLNHELSEHFDYFDYQIRQTNIANYINLIKEAKEKLNIPIIASINCVYSHEWTFFAQKVEEAGADALELNMFFLASDLNHTSEEREKAYYETVRKVVEALKIPVTLKISHYFTALGTVIKTLSETGIKGLVLFNRFYSPDIDIDKLTAKPSFVFSNDNDYVLPLKWITMMSDKVSCDLSASTGIHSGETVIKMLLAGATTVQVVSAVYKDGFKVISSFLEELSSWMKQKGFESIEDFKGNLNWKNIDDPSVYERIQFMKTFK